MASHARTAREIFNEAVENIPPEEWPEFLDRECEDDAAMRDRVQRLLDAHGDMGDFMKKPAAEPSPTVEAALSEKPGTEIGPYKLREQIGEGGFGVVYVAEQSHPVQRKVALKIVKPGMDSKEVVARFEAERQALALMDHPNVARVIDAGTTDNARPYFVMELVQGLPITDFCDKNKLTTHDRLQLFLNVCHAVQHAHQKGIIHRDLKPSNIMVTLHDGKPVPKVIDFGVAKALSQKLTEKTIYTSYGQVVGTPQYMSPEQAEMSGLGIDTRSDIYSLGVLLYELLTGKPPVDKNRLLASGYAEMMRIIREEEPLRPSRRISTLGHEATAIAHSRSTDEKKLSRSLRGELDWIVMKALEKDRERRYDTANSFAADVRRFLDNEAVQACPPSTAYRLRKFLRRNPAPVTVLAVGTVALMLAFGMLVSFRYSHRLETANVALKSVNDNFAEANSALARSLDREQELREAVEQSKDEADRALYFRRISQALSAWYDNKVNHAHHLLAECPPAWRHWEWYYANNLFHSGVTTIETDGWVMDVAVSPDGRRIASSGQGPNVSVWNIADGEKVLTLYGHTNNVHCVAFNTDGTQIASGSVDHTVRIWDAASGKELQTLEGHSDWVDAVAFNPVDNNSLVSCGWNGSVKVWDLASGRETHALKPSRGWRPDVAFIPDGKQFAVAHGRKLTLRDSETADSLYTLETSARYTSVAFSPDGKHMVSGRGDGRINLWELGGPPRISHTFEGHTADVWDLVFSNDGRRLVSGGADKTVRLWDVTTRREVRTLKGHTGSVNACLITPDSRWIVSGGGKTIRVWDTIDSQAVLTLNSGGSPRGPRISNLREGRLAAGPVDDDGRFTVWDSDSGDTILTKRAHETKLTAIALSVDAKRVATGSWGDNAVKVWDADTGKEILSLPGHEPGVFGVSFSPDGRRIASSSARSGQSVDHTIKVWDARKGGEALLTIQVQASYILSIGFSQDGTRLFAALMHVPPGFGLVTPSRVIVWNSETGDQIQKLDHPGGSGHTAAMSNDGTRLVSGGEDMKLRVWSVETGQIQHELDTDSEIHSVGFSPDDRRVASAQSDGTITVWDTESGEEALTIRAHNGRAFHVAFCPDGRRLVSASQGIIKVWDAGTTGFIAAAD